MKHPVAVACAVLLGLMLWLLLELHPYRGGKARLETYFGPILPPSVELIPLTIAQGSYWDDPRFRFRLLPEEGLGFNATIANEGFSNWNEQGGQYGSFYEDSVEGDPLLCAFKDDGKLKRMLFYRPSTRLVDAVTFRH